MFWIVISILPLIGVIISIVEPKNFEIFRITYTKYLNNFGVFSPLFFIALQVIQVVITPISHYIVGLIGGFLYGPYVGGILNWIGRVIGHVTAFYLSRKYGRKVVDKYVSKRTIDQFDFYIVGKNDASLNIRTIILFLIYFLPLFPDDEITYIVGISKMPFKNAFIAILLGQVGGSFSLALLGSGINTKGFYFWLLLLLTLAGFPIIYFLQRKYEKLTKQVNIE